MQFFSSYLFRALTVVRKCLASLMQYVGFEGRHGNKPRKWKLANKYWHFYTLSYPAGLCVHWILNDCFKSRGMGNENRTSSSDSSLKDVIVSQYILAAMVNS